jgi:hypothetical protein
MASRRRIATGLLALLVLAAVAGCGVPDSGPAVVVSSQAPADYDTGDPANGRQPVQPDPLNATTPDDSVRGYLAAAGADPDQVTSNVRRFFTRGNSGWQASNPVVVRITGYADSGMTTSQTAATVTVTGRRIGVLQNDGSVVPVSGSPGFTLTLNLIKTTNEDEPTNVWLIGNPPAETLLSTDALAADYDPWNVYFVSSSDGHTLVPDLRYVSRTLTPDRSRTTVVNWLLRGPSAWLDPAVTSAVPENTRLRANVTTDGNGTALVNLTGQAASTSNPDLLAAELCWTLLPRINGLRVEVEGQPLRLPGRHGAVQGRGTWRLLNSASALNANLTATQPAGYYVVDGRVVRADGLPLPQVLADPNAQNWNTGVVSAALSADSGDTALVRGTASGPQLVLGHLVQDTRQPRIHALYDPVTGLGRVGAIGRPSFLPGGRTVLVPVDGALYAATGRTEVTRVRLPAGVSGPVTSVAVATDGCRLALVAGGRLYVLPLQRDNRGTVALAAARQLVGDFTNLTEVAWSQEDRLVVGGRGPVGQNASATGGTRGGGWELSIDDASVDTLPPIDGNTVPDQVGAFPGDPSTGWLSGRVLLAGHGKVYQVYGNYTGGPNGGDDKPTGSSPFFPN